MKYLIPDFLLIFLIIIFTNEYVIACGYLFENIHNVLKVALFKYVFLACPLITIFTFSLFGVIRQSIIEKHYPIHRTRNFIKDNFIFIITAIVFALQILEAINEPVIISPDWITKIGKIQLLFNLIGLFCISSIVIHLLFELKRVFIKRSI